MRGCPGNSTQKELVHWHCKDPYILILKKQTKPTQHQWDLCSGVAGGGTAALFTFHQ